MLSNIAKYDLKSLKVELLIVIFVFSLLTIFAILNNANNIGKFEEEFYEIKGEELTRFSTLRVEATEKEAEMKKDKIPLTEERKGARSPSKLGNDGYKIFMPITNTTFISMGQYNIFPISVKVDLGIKEAFSTINNLENPFKLLVGSFDLAFVIIYLLPIFIIIFTYDITSSEKENGILKIILSNPVKLTDIVKIRSIVRFSVIMSTVLLSSTIGILLCKGGLLIGSNTMNVFFDNALNSDFILKILIFYLATIIYGLFWLALSLFINSKGIRNSTNSIILSTLWVLFVFILPNMINHFSSLLYPLPSSIEFVKASTEASEEARLKGKDILGKFLEDHPELAGKNIDASKVSIQKVMRNIEVEKEIKPIRDNYKIQVEKQQNFIENMKYLSPAIIMQSITFDLAGSGTYRYNKYNNAIENFHNEWKNFFYKKILLNQPVYANDYGSIPKFNFEEDSAFIILKKNALELTFIMLLNVFLIYVTTRNYKKFSII